MKKNKLVPLVVIGLVILVAVIFVLSSGDDASETSDEDTGEEYVSLDDQISRAFSDDTKETNDFQYEGYSWTGESDPFVIGYLVNYERYQGAESESTNQQLIQIQSELEQGNISPEEAEEQSAAAIEAQSSFLGSAYLSDDQIEQFVQEDQRDSYRSWRDEYYDQDGNPTKELPNPEDYEVLNFAPEEETLESEEDADPDDPRSNPPENR